MWEKAISGQYVPGDSWLHRRDPRSKLLASFLLLAVLFLAEVPGELLICGAIAALLWHLGQLPLAHLREVLRPFWLLILLVAVLQFWWGAGGTTGPGPLPFLGATRGWEAALALALRLILLIMVMHLLVATTTPLQLADAWSWYLSPLAKLGFPVAELVVIMAISLRFIPLFLQESAHIHKAQLARGIDFREGSLKQRLAKTLGILVPLLRNSLQRSEELAEAMEARAFQPGQRRGRLYERKTSAGDLVFLLVAAGLLALFTWW